MKRRFFMSPNKAKAISGKFSISQKNFSNLIKIKVIRWNPLSKGVPKPKNKFPKFGKMKVQEWPHGVRNHHRHRGTLPFIQGPAKVKINKEYNI